MDADARWAALGEIAPHTKATIAVAIGKARVRCRRA